MKNRLNKIWLKKIAAISIAAIMLSAAPKLNAQTAAPTPIQPADENPNQTEKSENEATVKTGKFVPPPYNIQRFDEDYSYLRDAGKRVDPFDRLKYIRLRKGRDDWYLTIGGEVRPFYERFDNNNFGAGAQDGNGYLLQRYMLHADWHFGKNFRVFAQLKSGVVADKSSPIAPPDVNKMDVGQLFIDFNWGVRREKSATGNNSAGSFGNANPNEKPNGLGFLPPRVTLRVGRQELNFGAGRIVSVRQGPNVRQSHDGISLIVRTGKWRIDGVLTKPVEDDRGFFDDEPRSDQTFWGVYAAHPLSFFSRAGKADVYYFGLDRKQARFDQGAGRDIRHTFGARFWNGGKSFDYDVEFTGQLGRFGRGNIRAWAISPSAGYTFQKTRFKPRLGVDAGIVSGDRNPNDKDLNTFAPPFPRGQYFGLIGANGAYNVRGFRPNFKLTLAKGTTITLSNFFFWRQSLADGFYSVPGGLLRTGRQSRARYIGQAPEIDFIWQVERHSVVQFGLSAFFTGKFLRETPPGKNIGYTTVRYTFQF